MPETQHIILQPEFLDTAQELRAHYDQRHEGCRAAGLGAEAVAVGCPSLPMWLPCTTSSISFQARLAEWGTR